MTAITEKLAALRERVQHAAAVAQRPAASVTIVAVSKTHPREAVLAAHAAGLRDFGENYVQEAVAKVTSLQDDPAGRQGLVWHYIGGIQANKTKAIAETFHWVQTVADARAAARLSRQRPYYAGDLQICLQVRPESAAAPARSGVPESELAALATEVAGMPRLALRGLMFMPLPGLDEPALRGELRRVRALFDGLSAAGHSLDTLSMGMSEDLEIAIAEGSTMVRIGTALFGARAQ